MTATRLAEADEPVVVWDPSVRILHWSLAASTVGAVLSGFAGAAFFGIHRACGTLILGLSVTRLVLGFSGSTTARFTEFVRGPTEVWRYLCSLSQSPHRRHFGHNPLGALMVLVLLGSILLQAIFGLYASDGIATDGPFARRIDEHLAEALGTLHSKMALVITALVCIHVAAVVTYRLGWSLDLVGPMISGRAPADSFVSAPERWQPGLSAWKVLVVAAMSIGVVAAIVLQG